MPKGSMTKKQKVLWLVSLLVLLLMMIAVGGITRLTKSGLSITEWRPITGILPPLNQQAWQEQFSLYQQSPEFLHLNTHFALDDYKDIFWWEYIHRILGRVIFFVAALLAYKFWRRKEASASYAFFLPSLIAFQGLIGWLMVKTGLNHRPSVSHYMLMVHFLLALLTMTVVYYPLAKMKKPLVVDALKKTFSDRTKLLLWSLGSLILLQIIYGCFVSGLNAGVHYNTSFPFMGGSFVPPFAWDLEPLMRNFFENPITIQWVHRWLGLGTAGFVLIASAYLLKYGGPSFKRPILHLVSVVGVQIILGISTLLWLIPTPLASLHQVMAVLVWLGYCNILFRVKLS